MQANPDFVANIVHIGLLKQIFSVLEILLRITLVVKMKLL